MMFPIVSFYSILSSILILILLFISTSGTQKLVLISGLLLNLTGRTLSTNDPAENIIPDEKSESESRKEIRAYVESLKTETNSLISSLLSGSSPTDSPTDLSNVSLSTGPTNALNDYSLPELQVKMSPKEEFLIDVPLHRAINIRFHTQTSQFKTHQNYLPSEPGSETVQTFVPPNRYVHRIHKPIVHELHEVIQPYHRQFRHIKPVQEYSSTQLFSPPKPEVNPQFVSGQFSPSDNSIFPSSDSSLSFSATSGSDSPLMSESSTSAIHDSSQNLKGDIEMDKIIARILQNYRFQNQNPLRSISSLSNPIIVNRFVLKQNF